MIAVGSPDGPALAAEDSGDTGPPLVLLHGLGSTRRWWDLVVAELGGCRVIRWDHRGHGESAAPPGDYTLDALAGDAADVLDVLGVGGCVVAGHSMGASVALLLGAQRPDLVAAVCCVEGGLGDPRVLLAPTWALARTTMCLDRRTLPTPAMLDAWADSNGLPVSARPPIRSNYRPAASQPGRLELRLAPEHEAALAHSTWCLDPGPLVARITAPVRAVLARPTDQAEVERRNIALVRTLNTARRDAEVVWIDGGHYLPLHQPRLTADAIGDMAHPRGLRGSGSSSRDAR